MILWLLFIAGFLWIRYLDGVWYDGRDGKSNVNRWRSKLMQKVFRYCAGVVVLGLAASFPAQAAEWVQASQISDNFREVDKSSIRGAKPQLTFISRLVINDARELKIGREVVKYLVMEQRVDCTKRTTVMLSSEAQRADMSVITRQKLVGQEESPVLEGSVDEDVLKVVCAAAAGS
jgi:hypothetical protein